MAERPRVAPAALPAQARPPRAGTAAVRWLGSLAWVLALSGLLLPLAIAALLSLGAATLPVRAAAGAVGERHLARAANPAAGGGWAVVEALEGAEVDEVEGDRAEGDQDHLGPPAPPPRGPQGARSRRVAESRPVSRGLRSRTPGGPCLARAPPVARAV